MTFKSVISAILVAILALLCMLGTQKDDLNLMYAAFCSSPYVILMAIFYFHFNYFRRKLNLLQRPNVLVELAYGFVFYLAGCMLFPVLLFVGTIGDNYEHKIYEDLGSIISEMLPLFLILSVFLTIFSAIIIGWAIKSYKTLILVLVGYTILVPLIYSFAEVSRDYHKAKEKAENIADNIKEGRYEWHGAMSNPTAYPVQLYKGYFTFPKDEKSEFTFSEGNTVNYKAKWGEDGGGTYREVKSLPKAIDVTWFSFAEDTFYRVNSLVDYQKLRGLFSKSFTDKRVSRFFDENYDSIIMGFAPGGVMVIWAGSTGRRQVEIGRYQAEKVIISTPVSNTGELKYEDLFNREWRKKVLTDTMVVPSKIQQLTKNKPIPYGYWDKLRATYNWRPTFVVSAEIKIHDADFSFYNAERFVFFDESLQSNEYEKRGIPENVYLKWYDKNGNRCAADFDFNEDQTFKKFDVFFNQQKNASGEIEFNIDQKTKKATATLKNGGNKVLLLETEIVEYGKKY
ncbi:DUF2931 family protein [Pedobacter gandavensis]|uniref:DUF2931 family protein n=1 Tax=Pedobacter gandavensis TaxID=2679963 RepID=A0ABR6ETT6_9SPHI|nr:DUF2931 family protein [Pedobacter gandavensis]MBB2148673.1 DUF2931 family protein [Pedobacter gandavensis]